MNKVILLGRLTKDPETRYSQASEPVAVTRYTLAVNRRFRREGEPEADFINCVAFGKIGEFAERYFKKGMMVGVSGRLQIRPWDDQNGQRHWQTEVILEDQYFAESKSSFEQRAQTEPRGDGYGAPGNYGGQSQFQDQGYAPPARANPPSPNNAGSDGFFAIDESLDDEDLPF